MKHISILGASMDLGQQRRGVDMGPSAIRYAGVVERLQNLGHQVTDLGDLAPPLSASNASESESLRNLSQVVEVNTRLAKEIDDIIASGSFPLTLGGDHSIAIGSVAGVSGHYKNPGVIWYDAHADLNTSSTSPSGNIHGMPLAAALGLGEEQLSHIGGSEAKLRPENIVIFGARALDDREKQLIKQLGIKVYTMHEIDRHGMSAMMAEAIAYLKEKTDGVHLSLDLDALDPQHAPGVGTPVVGGLSYRESHLAMEMLAEAEIITSADFVEVNPILDEKNRTAKAAVDLIGSLFGEKLC
ncbi:arginase [Sinobaca qinghaiensis]|uniref:Arginase n=1 Tax=Sinobaca qinghaiensis TaxID=342944 RepID=A0A419V599_9BACL|nr:arginase [Sinobaca qinghaiensis]RKD75128.1 arginase [Sinobaca qinghaiensis]